MSIYFSFTMKPKKKLFKKTELNYTAFVEALRKREKEEQIQLEVKSRETKVTYCPEGNFWITYKQEDNKLSGDCQTNVAGPGFHAASISLLEKIAYDLDLKLIVEDDTGFAKHKDFDRMRREHFYPWLQYIMELLCEQFSKTDFKICWNIDSYSPKTIPGTVITPIRRFTISEIKSFLNRGPESFAEEFFVWNEEKRDARYYRNSALVEMSTNCHFMSSDRSIWDGVENIVCLQLLEKALQYDSSLPFPKKEYQLLCRLHEQPYPDLEGIPDMIHECEIGYRRQEIIHQLGMFRYSVYGCCLERYDKEKNTVLYYDDAPGHWHNIRITSFHFGEKRVGFTAEMFTKSNVEQVLEFPVSEGNCKLAIYKPVPLEKSPEGFYYEINAQMVLDNQLLLVAHTYCRAEEKEDILDWFRRIEGKRKKTSI